MRSCFNFLGGFSPLFSRSNILFKNETVTRNLTEGLFGGFLTAAWNKVDSKRLKEVGPDRLCAEWLLRCGGACKTVGRTSWYADYNALINVSAKTRIEAIDCTATCINSGGFRHLHGLTAVKYVKIDNCLHFCDAGLGHLAMIGDTLITLRLANCPQITENGLLEHLKVLTNLEKLEFHNLQAVDDLDGVVNKLKLDLPRCNVSKGVLEDDTKVFDRN